jgi:hypothetical protein
MVRILSPPGDGMSVALFRDLPRQPEMIIRHIRAKRIFIFMIKPVEEFSKEV